MSETSIQVLPGATFVGKGLKSPRRKEDATAKSFVTKNALENVPNLVCNL